jgi:hypothetical protein
MAKGIAWQKVKVSSLDKDLQDKHAKYMHALDTANNLATELKSSLKAAWQKKFPDGIDGKVASFNITGGSLQMAMTAGKTDTDDGVDAFARPLRQ